MIYKLYLKSNLVHILVKEEELAYFEITGGGCSLFLSLWTSDGRSMDVWCPLGYSISNWVTYLFQTFLLVDDAYYRWDNRLNQVHSGYPVKNTRSFLACASNSEKLRDQNDIGSSSALHSPLQNLLYVLIILFYYALFL